MVYRTMQGREIDMEKLMQKNELVQAVGNAKVNARGDKLGPGGKILKTREQVVAEYYENNPRARNKPKAPEVAPTVVETQPATKNKKTQSEE